MDFMLSEREKEVIIMALQTTLIERSGLMSSTLEAEVESLLKKMEASKGENHEEEKRFNGKESKCVTRLADLISSL